MAIRKRARTIGVADIRINQVLEIVYDGDTHLILVVDPIARTVVNTSQGRANKLHAIKLENFSDTELLELVTSVRSLGRGRTVSGKTVYDLYKTSRFSAGSKNYRTYSLDKISNVKRITLGETTEPEKLEE